MKKFIFAGLFMFLFFGLIYSGDNNINNIINWACDTCTYKIKQVQINDVNGQTREAIGFMNVWIKDKNARIEYTTYKGTVYDVNIVKGDDVYIYKPGSNEGAKYKMEDMKKFANAFAGLGNSMTKESEPKKIGSEKVAGVNCDIYENVQTIEFLFVKNTFLVTKWLDKNNFCMKYKTEKLELINGNEVKKFDSSWEIVEMNKKAKVDMAKFDLPENVVFREQVAQNTENKTGKKDADTNEDTSNTEEKKEKSLQEKVIEKTVQEGAGSLIKGVLGW